MFSYFIIIFLLCIFQLSVFQCCMCCLYFFLFFFKFTSVIDFILISFLIWLIIFVHINLFIGLLWKRFIVQIHIFSAFLFLFLFKNKNFENICNGIIYLFFVLEKILENFEILFCINFNANSSFVRCFYFDYFKFLYSLWVFFENL